MKMSKAEITKQKLLEAIQRLRDGKPINTPEGSKITKSLINKEADVSYGQLNKHPDALAEAILLIEEHEEKQQKEAVLKGIEAKDDKETRLKNDRNKQERLKRDYRGQRDTYKEIADNAVKREASLMFRLHQIEVERQSELNRKVTPLR